MYPSDPDPCLQQIVCGTRGSLSGLMYVDIIFGLVLLLQAAILFVPLRKQRGQWFAVVPFVLAVAAFALAWRMWDLYWQHVAFPHFPPGWFDSTGDIGPYGLLTTSLFWATALLLIPAAIAAIYLLRDAVRYVLNKWH